jgi:hypothetical protein
LSYAAAGNDHVALFVGYVNPKGRFDWVRTFPVMMSNEKLKDVIPIKCGMAWMEQTDLGGSGNLLVVGSFYGEFQSMENLRGRCASNESFLM